MTAVMYMCGDTITQYQTIQDKICSILPTSTCARSAVEAIKPNTIGIRAHSNEELFQIEPIANRLSL